MNRRLSQVVLSGVLLVLVTGCPTTGPGFRDDDDGPVVLYPAVEVGALVITEVLAHPNVGRPEYLEVVNASDEDVDLLGCQVADGGTGEHTFNIIESVVLAPGELALLGGAEFLGASEGQLPTDVAWDEITLAQSDVDETASLRCPDGTGARQVTDEIAFHWSGLGLRRGHSWQLVAAPDADLNDDPAQWCEAPIQDDAVYAVVDGQPDYGTPGGPTVCETPGGEVPGEGEVVITEILVDEFTGLREWFELYNPTDVTLDIRDCVLGDAPADGSTDPNTYILDAELGRTVLEPGELLLLSKTDLDVTSDGSILSDYPYGALGFNNSDLQRLWLDCGATRIDEIQYDWGSFGSDFEGRSLSLSDDSLSATANDDSASWCLATDEDAYWTFTDSEDDPETFTAWGTPGEANPGCPIPDPFPRAGDIVFTEILVRSAGADIGHNEEWFEVRNVGSARVSLLGCTIRNDDGDGAPDDHVIDDPFGFAIDPGAYAVLVKSSAADTLACSIPAAYLYGTNISFGNDATESLALFCPGEEGDVQIDSFTFAGGFEPGHPWQLRTGSESAEANDVAANWCTNTETSGYTWSCIVGADTNYGTPGGGSWCP